MNLFWFSTNTSYVCFLFRDYPLFFFRDFSVLLVGSQRAIRSTVMMLSPTTPPPPRPNNPGSTSEFCTVRTPVFGRHQFFGTSEHYGKAHGSLLSGWMNYNYTACCWFPTSNNILILPSQFWQISFESYWLHCSKCRILVLLRYTCKYFITSGMSWSCVCVGGGGAWWQTHSEKQTSIIEHIKVQLKKAIFFPRVQNLFSIWES